MGQKIVGESEKNNGEIKRNKKLCLGFLIPTRENENGSGAELPRFQGPAASLVASAVLVSLSPVTVYADLRCQAPHRSQAE